MLMTSLAETSDKADTLRIVVAFLSVGPWRACQTRRWGRCNAPATCQILSSFRPGAALTAFFRSL